MRTLCTLLLLAAGVLADDPAEAPGGDPFARDLFARLAARDGNFVFSPLSVRVGLAMTYGGARGDTAKEMEAVLRCDKEIHAELAERLADLDRGRVGSTEIAVVNALWAQQGDPFLPEFLALARDRYGAPVERVDFRGDGAAARRRINRWVAEGTRGRIEEIVDPETVGPATSLVLTNALYFRGAWNFGFLKRFTKDAPFALATGEAVEVPFMAQTVGLRYAEQDGVQAVELPYMNYGVGMVVVLPPAGQAATLPDQILDRLEARPVRLYLPRFRFSTNLRLDDTLKAMGMAGAFGPGADFSGMNGQRDLFISSVSHRAFIAVDEAGTEAAAAVAVGMAKGGEPEAPVEFRADRPFVFVIRRKETGTILFAGRVSDPR